MARWSRATSTHTSRPACRRCPKSRCTWSARRPRRRGSVSRGCPALPRRLPAPSSTQRANGCVHCLSTPTPWAGLSKPQPGRGAGADVTARSDDQGAASGSALSLERSHHEHALAVDLLVEELVGGILLVQ